MNVVQALRLARELAFFDSDVLGIGAAPADIRPSVNFIARFPLSHAWAGGFNDARNVPSQDEGERIIPEAPQVSGAIFQSMGLIDVA